MAHAVSRRPLALTASDTPLRASVGGVGIAGFFALWQVLAAVVGDPSTLAPPLAVVGEFIRLLGAPFAGSTLGGHAWASLERFGAGYGLSVAIGIPLGLAMGSSNVTTALVSPLFDLLRFVAPIAWVPFAVLWFGTGFGGPLLIIFSGAFPACVLGAYGGARLVDARLVEAARMLGARRLRIALEVVLPSALPAIASALRVAAGNAWQSLVGAELIVATSGLAYTMVRGQMNRTIVVVLVGMLAIGLIGLALDAVFGLAERGLQRRLGRVVR